VTGKGGARAAAAQKAPGRGGPPRSGKVGWAPIGAAALAVGLLYLAIFSVPPLITVFVDDLGYSHAEAGALMSVCLGGFLVSSLVSGRLAARFGPVPLLVAGLILCGVATACFPITESLPIWLVCRAAVGVSGGLIYAPGVTLVTSLLPPERANLGVGMFLCGLSIGGTVAYFATRLLEEGLGWRWPSWIFGAAVIVGAAVVRGLAGSAGHARAGPKVAAGAARAVLRSRPFRLLFVSLFVSLFVAYGVFTWIPPYFEESAGFSTAEISVASALLTLVGIPATFGFGWLAYRSGRPLLVAALGLALPALVAVFAATVSPPYGVAIVVGSLAAFGVSGGLAPLYATPPLLFPGAFGATASGIAASAGMGGAVVSTYLGGWIVEAADGYGEAFWIYAGGAVVASCVLLPLLTAALGRMPVEAAEARSL
jgi:predicted MFS family arabinose efflux permease